MRKLCQKLFVSFKTIKKTVLIKFISNYLKYFVLWKEKLIEFDVLSGDVFAFMMNSTQAWNVHLIKYIKT